MEIIFRDRETTNATDMKWMKSLDELKFESSRLILGLKSEDSSYLMQAGPGIGNCLDKKLPVLLTAIKYFSQIEVCNFKIYAYMLYCFRDTLNFKFVSSMHSK